MVGVPRSTGCMTCRGRKVKCDETKPICQRCAKAGFECGGYAKETIWRHTSTAPFPHITADNTTGSPRNKPPRGPVAMPWLPKRTPGAAQVGAATESSGSGKNTGGGEAGLGGGSSSNSSSSTHVTTTAMGKRPILGPNNNDDDDDDDDDDPSLPAEMSLQAFEGDFCFSFMFTNFVWRGYGNQWLRGAAEGRLGTLALASSRALAQSTFGRAKGVADVERKGAVQYGQCLDMLARELSRLRGLSREGVSALLVPVLVLLMHASTLTDQVAASFHVTGMVELIRMAGPEAFQHQPLLNALEAARATIVVASLITRQKTFFDDPKWVTEPWKLNIHLKPAQSYLLDILSSIPGILRDYDTLTEMEQAASSPANVFGESDALQVSINDRLKSLLEGLYRWRWRWESQNGHQVTVATDHQANTGSQQQQRQSGSSSEHHSTSSSSRRLQSPRHHRISFRSARAAADIMQYNAVLMWLLALILEVSPFLGGATVESCARAAAETSLAAHQQNQQQQQSGSRSQGQNQVFLSRFMSFDPLRGPGSSVSVRDAAVEICRAYEWQSSCHSRRSGGGSPSQASSSSRDEANLLYMFPLGMAMSVLDGDDAGTEWITELLETDPLTRGYGGYARRTSAGSVTPPGFLSGGQVSDAERVKNFGYYLLREIPELGKEDRGHDVRNTGRISNPGLIHLLLLRGRARQDG